ncbi:Alpha/Beta hydrolase protein [Infundibulicybe gibba]|nr:Alpha/Beta hydrolase protein [Infundibulicybe gibba]
MIWFSFLSYVFALLFCERTIAGSPRPLVLWHGLGDSHSSPGMLEFASLIKDMHPGIFVHSVYIDEDLDEDKRAGFYGNVNDQIDVVAQQLAAIPQLASGFDAIGFSQGGQFLRAYVERYNSPPINNLITFGSQHMGISDIPLCRPYDFLCQVARRATKGAVYSSWAQTNLVQTYARNLATLNSLVLVIFTQDKTVVPKESAWFGSQAVDPDSARPFGESSRSGMSQQVMGGDNTIIPMRMQPLYIEDWIGLRQLDERGAVVLETCEGEHMRISGCWKTFVEEYVGGEL